MSQDQFLTLLLAIIAQTGAIVWWAASLHVTVRQHDKQITDHELRLRKADL